MIRFFCNCGNEIFFENTHCFSCGSILGFNPLNQQLQSLPIKQVTVKDNLSITPSAQLCYRHSDINCNWLVLDYEANSQCLACRTTRMIPNLTASKNLLRWQRLEQTKRRALYTLLKLGLPFGDFKPTVEGSKKMSLLTFDFLEDRRSNPDVYEEIIYSGHRNGVITVNAAEADDSFRTSNRELFNELYRTLLGHFRHELGHYYGQMLSAENQTEFRKYFGDERQDYQTLLQKYYQEGVVDGWQEDFISAYASAHPWEDWAETWTHYLHIRDTLETAKAYGMVQSSNWPMNFNDVLSEWSQVTVTLNALTRSMGVDDAYPFVITSKVAAKLYFIDRQVKFWQANDHTQAKP